MEKKRRKRVHNTKGISIMDEIEKRVYEDGYRPSNPQTLQHINSVKTTYNELLKGATSSIIRSGLQNDAFGLGIAYSAKQAERIYLEAKDLIIADFNEDRQYAKSKLLACLQDIYTECRETNDKYNAIQSIKEMAKLLDLYEYKSKQQTVTVKTQDTEIEINFGLDNDTISDNINETPIQDAQIIDVE